MNWIKVENEKPKLVHDFDGSEEPWKASEYVLIGYRDMMAITDKYEIAKYEKGESFEQWYSPQYDDAIEDPDFFCYIDEFPEP